MTLTVLKMTDSILDFDKIFDKSDSLNGMFMLYYTKNHDTVLYSLLYNCVTSVSQSIKTELMEDDHPISLQNRN